MKIKRPLFLVTFFSVALLLSAVPSNPKRNRLPKADKIVIEKAKRKLILLSKGKIIKTYKIALGRHPKGAKTKRGDKKTPEGIYTIDYRIRNSGYHRALHISYPNQKDLKRAEKQKVDPGGDIMIHGIKNGFGWLGRLHRLTDWTLGCIAVTNSEIEEIWNLVPNGTVVEIKP